jgi:hypothetical protein
MKASKRQMIFTVGPRTSTAATLHVTCFVPISCKRKIVSCQEHTRNGTPIAVPLYERHPARTEIDRHFQKFPPKAEEALAARRRFRCRCATQASGPRDRGVSDWKELDADHVARSGLMSVRLARPFDVADPILRELDDPVHDQVAKGGIDILESRVHVRRQRRDDVRAHQRAMGKGNGRPGPWGGGWGVGAWPQ